ncbi:MAG: hypothetical protein LKJ44_01815 [Bifidobacteriaceae bacterium]|nr:hypothetical protein [Bifidobacteriaceae bacterium]
MNSYTELSARPLVDPSAENAYSATTNESQENTFLSGSGNNSNGSGGSAPSRGLRTLLFPWLDAMGRMLTHFVEPASIALM